MQSPLSMVRRKNGAKALILFLTSLLLAISLGQAAFGAPDVTFGDVNDDGKIDVRDAVMVMQYILELKELDNDQIKAADVTGDGKIDVNDVSQIMQYSLGIIDRFTVHSSIKSVERVEIDVSYGTAQDNIGLPEEVEITLYDNSSQDVSVKWEDISTPEYQQFKYGHYVFRGELDQLPQDVFNPKELKAIAVVGVGYQVRQPRPAPPPPDAVVWITGVEALAAIEVSEGTNFADIGLPSEVEVTFDDDSTSMLDVDWDEGDYDGDTPGDYDLEGELVLEEGQGNPDNLKAEITVTVEPATLEVVSVVAITTTGVEVTFEELTEDIDGATVEVIDPDATVHPVEPLDLVEGDTTATFEFVDALAEVMSGTWTVNGVDFLVDPTEEEALADLKKNTSIELTSEDNVVTAVISYPDTIYEVLEDYTVDALIEVLKGNVFEDGTRIEINYNDDKVGVVVIDDDWEHFDEEAIYLSKLIAEADLDGEIYTAEIPAYPDGRTGILGHEGRTDTWTLTIEPADPTLSDIRVTSQVSDDWADPIDIASDQTRVDFDVPDTVTVVDAATLERALANEDIKTIILANDITVGQDVTVQYDQTLDLDGYTLEVEADYNLYVAADTKVTCGTIAAFVVINENGVTLTGPNAGIPGYEVRGCESLIVPPPDAPYVNPFDLFPDVIWVTAEDVVIDGFKLEPLNPNADPVESAGVLESGYQDERSISEINGKRETEFDIQTNGNNNDYQAANAIYGNDDGLEVRNNIIKGFPNVGVWVYRSHGDVRSIGPITGIVVADNHIKESYDGNGFGFYIQGAIGHVLNNTVEEVFGNQIQPYDAVAAPNEGVVSGNTISTYGISLYHNRDEKGGEWTYSGNTLTADPNASWWYGILIEAVNNDPTLIFTDNTIDGMGIVGDFGGDFVNGLRFRGEVSEATCNNLDFSDNNMTGLEIYVEDVSNGKHADLHEILDKNNYDPEGVVYEYKIVVEDYVNVVNTD